MRSTKLLDNLQKNLSSLMKANNITGDSLSNSTSISKATISRLRKGQSNPTLDILVPICKFFNISLSEIFNEDFNISKSELNKTNQINKTTAKKIPVVQMSELVHNVNHTIDGYIYSELTGEDIFAIKDDSIIPTISNCSYLIVKKTKSILDSQAIVIKNTLNNKFSICQQKYDINGTLIRSLKEYNAPWQLLNDNYEIVASVLQIKQYIYKVNSYL